MLRRKFNWGSWIIYAKIISYIFPQQLQVRMGYFCGLNKSAISNIKLIGVTVRNEKPVFKFHHN